MRTRARLLGHPLHPTVVSIPIGLFLLSLVFDLIAMSGSTVLGTAAFWSILGGIAGGLLAAALGPADWTAIPARTRAKRIGLWHAAINVVVVVLFAVSWLMRLRTEAHEPDWTAIGFEIAGIASLLVSGWLGGELVDRLGVGVDEEANVNATSSLARVSSSHMR